MDGLIIPIIAIAAAVGVFAIWQIVSALTNGEKRKIKQRLSTENVGSGGGSSAQNLSITVQQDISGLSGQLIQFSLF